MQTPKKRLDKICKKLYKNRQNLIIMHMKKLEKSLFGDVVLLTNKRLWTICIIIALVLAAFSVIPALIKVMSL